MFRHFECLGRVLQIHWPTPPFRTSFIADVGVRAGGQLAALYLLPVGSADALSVGDELALAFGLDTRGSELIEATRLGDGASMISNESVRRSRHQRSAPEPGDWVVSGLANDKPKGPLHRIRSASFTSAIGDNWHLRSVCGVTFESYEVISIVNRKSIADPRSRMVYFNLDRCRSCTRASEIKAAA